MAIAHPSQYPHSANPKRYPAKWSNIEIRLKNNESIVFMMKAGLGITKHLVKDMQSTGFLHLYNDKESIIVASSEILAMNILEITKDE